MVVTISSGHRSGVWWDAENVGEGFFKGLQDGERHHVRAVKRNADVDHFTVMKERNKLENKSRTESENNSRTKTKETPPVKTPISITTTTTKKTTTK